MVSKDDNRERDDALRRLFLGLFTARELRDFIRFGPRGGELSLHLPGSELTAAEAAGAIVALLVREDAIDANLFDRLINERPRRVEEVREVQHRFLGTAPNIVEMRKKG